MHTAVFKEFAVWLGLLVVLSALGLAWLAHDGVDIRTGFGPGTMVVAYSPTLSALIAATLMRGKAGLAQLWQSLLRWRVGTGWYFFSIALPVVLVLSANALVTASNPAGAHAWWHANWAALGAGLGPIFAGSLGEEMGWRGFAQPTLQRRLGALTACVIVGAIWGTWHLNAEFVSPGSTPLIAAAAQSYVRMIATAILYGWLYERTGGSLPVVMVAHAGHNMAIDLFFPEEGAAALAPVIVSLYALAAVPAAFAMVRRARAQRPRP